MHGLGRHRIAVYEQVSEERRRQDAMFGEFAGKANDSDERSLTVLAEEFGEVARAVLEHDDENLEEELTQVAAVCVAWLEARRDQRGQAAA